MTKNKKNDAKQNLAKANPELAKEWDYEANADAHKKDANHPLTPKDITIGSEKKVYWKIKNVDTKTNAMFPVFKWSDSVYHRVRGAGCLYLSGKAILVGFNDLATKNPKLAKEWDYEANAEAHKKNPKHPLTPQDITSGSTKKVFWKIKNTDNKTCEKFPYLRWCASVVNRNKGNGCPYIGYSPSIILVGFNDLATQNPKLAAEWDYEANANAHKSNPKHPLTPDEVMPGSNLKVFWKIKNTEPETCNKIPWLKWEAIVSNRNQGHGCPYIGCSPTKVLVGFNDLLTRNPELASEWDYEANADAHAKNAKHPKRPEDVAPGSQKKVFWRIKNTDTLTCDKTPWLKWNATVCSRNEGKGCPLLNLRKGEELIKNVCIDNNYIFSTQAKYLDLIDEKCLLFDFHIATHTKRGILIEYDGIQHFEPNEYYGLKSFQSGIKHDNMKNQYAQDKNISLLRIPYIYDPVKDKEKIKDFVCNFVKTQTIPSEILDFYKNIKHSNYYDCMMKLQAKRNVNNLIKINEIAI